MKFFSTLILFSMLMLTAACSHEPTMSDEFADVQLDNSSPSEQAAAAPSADAVESAPSDLDLTPPSDPTPPARVSHHVAKHHHKKKHSKKKKLAKHKHHSRRDSELARSNY